MAGLHQKLVLFFLVCTIACLIAAPLPAVGEDASATKIAGFQAVTKGKTTRLIFDAEGAKPKQVGPASSDGVSVFFSDMMVRIPDKSYAGTSGLVKAVKFRRGSNFFEVLFRAQNTVVTHRIEKAKKAGRYKLVLELSPPPNGAAVESPPKENEKPIVVVEIRKIDTKELFGSNGSQQYKPPTPAEEKKKAEAAERAHPVKPQSFVAADPQTAALYKAADEKYESCSHDPILCGPAIVQAYSEAVKAGPKTAGAPEALYRIGNALWSMGSYNKAERYFRQVISDWPDQPAVSRSWIGIGDISNKRQSYVEAMEAFRSALRAASDKKDKAAAAFELGRELQFLGANKDALDMLTQCVGNDPEYHYRRPEVLRLFGETEFALGMFDKAKEHFLKYTNLQQSASDQDMVYAKLAEAFLCLGDSTTANKLYNFVGKYYANSEGDVICKIRKAELLEKTDIDQSLGILDRLGARDLSPTLRKIVFLKQSALNLKKGNLARSLEIVEDVFQGKTEIAPGSQMIDLRDNILIELVRKNYSAGNYLKVVQLYEKYRPVFDAVQTPDTLESVAESYAALKFYPSALEIYDRILTKKKTDDILFRCALYSVRACDYNRAELFCKQVQSDAYDLKKSELLGHITYNDQKYADAGKYFGKVVQKQKEFQLKDPNSLQYYGYTLFELKRFDEAISFLQKDVERLKPEDAETRCAILIKMSKCYGELKQYAKAAEMVEVALHSAKQEQANELLYELSKLYLLAGQPDKAVEDLNQLVGTQHPFWAAVAQQQLNTIQMAQNGQGRQ